MQHINDARDQKAESIINETMVELAEINQKYSKIQIPYLNAKKIETKANNELTTSTAILSNAVETQTQEVKLANEHKTKSLKDALKLKKDSIELYVLVFLLILILF